MPDAESDRLIPDETRATFWRTLQTFAFTRTLIVIVLLGYFSWNADKVWPEKQHFLDVCAVYLGLSGIFVLFSLYWRRRFMMQVAVQIAVDITAISILYFAVGGLKSGMAILFLFPLAGGAILAPLLLAMFFVSTVTLILLAENGYQLLNENADISSSQVGFYGAAFFIVIFAINRLAARLIKQEALALGRGKALQVQQAINRLVIADMEDGILVVDRKGRVLITNPAAARMLGLSFPQQAVYGKLANMTWLQPIADAYHAWDARFGMAVAEQMDCDAPTFVLIKHGDDVSAAEAAMEVRRELVTHLKLRFARVESDSEDRVVIFLQDVTEIENRAQQLKLASMGRLTASIAHEVRNPLAAIAHASSLLAEDEPNIAQQRLLAIIGDNVARLNRMIEDILKLSRKAHQYQEPLDPRLLIDEVLLELCETHGIRADLIRVIHIAPYAVRFDPLHFREILLNLLSNALRYASGAPGSIRIQLLAGTGYRPELHVQDDGPEITAVVRAHLFEPFYTTSNKGTGLGLYLARELCLNNSAMLNYEYRSDNEHTAPSGRFVITFANADAD